MKHYHYVLIKTNKEIVFLTDFDNYSKTAHWYKNKSPLQLSKLLAEDLAYCLTLNGHSAYVLESCQKIEKQIFIKERKKNEKIKQESY